MAKKKKRDRCRDEHQARQNESSELKELRARISTMSLEDIQKFLQSTADTNVDAYHACIDFLMTDNGPYTEEFQDWTFGMVKKSIDADPAGFLMRMNKNLAPGDTNEIAGMILLPTLYGHDGGHQASAEVLSEVKRRTAHLSPMEQETEMAKAQRALDAFKKIKVYRRLPDGSWVLDDD